VVASDTGTKVTAFQQRCGLRSLIGAGSHHSLAIRADGTVAAWGANGSGQLGTADYQPRFSPTTVSALPAPAASVAAGDSYSLVLLSDGTVWSFGDNSYGQLGTGSIEGNSTTPQRVVGLSGVTQIAAGYTHALAVKADGTVWSWGRGWEGQLGNGIENNEGSPGQILGQSGSFIQVAGGQYHSLVLRNDGVVFAFGANWSGQVSASAAGSLDGSTLGLYK
jgi:alpha-tubulin suppressor-like RCC1 family protein